jgi:Uma2 family endonuclease
MPVPMSSKTQATIDDLYRAPGKAEIVDGEIVPMSPTGFLPGYAGGEIFASLREHVRRTKSGIATPDNVGFRVDLPNRSSFCPDVAFYIGRPTGMKFLLGAPVFAVEIRSEGDYGPKAEVAIKSKRLDYFAAGTLVVWDVDLLSPDVIRSYNSDDPSEPSIYRRGDVAFAELAAPGWSIAVDDLFPTTLD